VFVADIRPRSRDVVADVALEGAHCFAFVDTRTIMHALLGIVVENGRHYPESNDVIW
jgi:hypothetical protein